LAFGPDGILLVGDTMAAAIIAIDTQDPSTDAGEAEIQIDNLDAALADVLETEAANVSVQDLAVNPQSGNVYLSVSVAMGGNSIPGLVRIDRSGKLSKFSTDGVPFSMVNLPNAPEDKETGEGRRRRNNRAESITDIAYNEGKVLVSGLSSEAAPSKVRQIDFPFVSVDNGTSVEIYHGAHGRLEDNATIRTFVPFNIGGEPTVLAGFTCTPLVKFPIDSLQSGSKVRGTTVAELGNRNQPLDMVVYEKDGKSFLLLSNSRRGVMKISTEDIARPEGITSPIRDGNTAGQSYETIDDLQGVVQLDRLNDQQAIVITQSETGQKSLATVPLP
jgi:hypothetical protein